MRRVEVLKYAKDLNTGKWVFAMDGTAIFHQFGNDYEEFESGPGNYTVAVIERPDGKVEMVRADHIRFIQDVTK
jgi:hypothetical protein